MTIITANENTTEKDNTNTLNQNTQTTHQINKINQTAKNIKTDTTSVKSYQELYDTIETAKKTSNSQTITLEDGDYNITKAIEIRGQYGPMTITINGQNNIINGQNMKSFITVTKSNTLIINNLTIENTNSTAGSGIFSKGNVNITNTTFKNCYSESWISNCGGAIYNSGTMNINNCTFTNNTIITDSFGGGAIFNNGILNVENSTFQENNALKGSAIFSLKSKTNITNSNFTYNNANKTATIYNFNSTVKITDCQFDNNKAVNSSILETTDKGINVLYNTTITNHQQSTYLIRNLGNTTLYKCSIDNNDIILNLIENEDQLRIINSTIRNNNASDLISNKELLIIEDSMISLNNVNNFIIENNIEYDESICSINNTFFDSNKGKSALYDLNSTMLVSNSIFINNTSNELFNGTTDTFKNVHNNTYYYNSLSSKMESPDELTFNYDENITFTCLVETLPIYNTTVDTGIITVYDDEEKIATFNVTNSSGEIKLINNITNKSYNLVYTDYSNYKDSSNLTVVRSLYPIIEIEIKTSDDDDVSYKDMLNYSIVVKNIGEGNSSDLCIYNNLPDSLEVVGCNSTSYDYDTNTWLIDRLDSMSECELNITVQVNTYEDFNLSIALESNDKPVKYVKDIHVSLSDVHLDFDIKRVDYALHENYTFNINVNNLGETSSPNTIVSIVNDDRIVQVFETGSILENSSCLIEVHEAASHVGENILIINSTDTLTNQTRSYMLTFNVNNLSVNIDELNVRHGDLVNITAHVDNVVSLTENTISVFKINGITIHEHNITVNDNEITLENFIIPYNWSKQNYTLEVKVLDAGFEEVILNTSMIRIMKKQIISHLDDIRSLPGNRINITARLVDEDGNPIDYGFVKFKINGKTIDYLVPVKGGIACLEYSIPDTFRGRNYSLSMVYGENRLYTSNRNTSSLTLAMQDCIVNITNSTYTRGDDFHIYATIYGKDNMLAAYSGKVIFKLNDVTFTDIIYVTNSFVNCTIINPNIKAIYNITLCYSGNNVLSSTRETISFKGSTSK